ncbi:MAG: hypothetical protein Q9160_004622 [Pyrenula sp. 1 TL-2023]
MDVSSSPPSNSLASNLPPDNNGFKSREVSNTQSHHTMDASSSPLDSRAPSVHDYNYSGIYDESSTQSEREDYTDDDPAQGHETVSSRSSISSLPMSVAPSMMQCPPDATTPTKSSLNNHGRLSSLSNGIRSPKRRLEKDHDSPFRHPSSIIAMQMRDEDEMSQLRRGSNMTRRLSNFSNTRSSTPVSPSKRHSRSMHSTPQKPRVKKEYPLVLLHCTLLPPVLPLHTKITDPMLLHEILPQEYWRRWKLLNDKVIDNGEVSARGVLIPHPQGDYDLLEERLLESLELAKPRIRSGHFLGDDQPNSSSKEDESAEALERGGEEEQADAAQQGTKCPDCGTRVLEDVDRDRKWEIKVYAANGLMRAGAWSAAWNEMEKVDVEVGVWLPEAVRRQIEETLHDVGIDAADPQQPATEPEPAPAPSESVDDARRREIYGENAQNDQDKIDGLFEDDSTIKPSRRRHRAQRKSHQEEHFRVREDPDLKTLLMNYIQVLSQDTRNVAIALLSIVVLFYALSSPSSSAQNPIAAVAPVEPVSISSPATTITSQVFLQPAPAASTSETLGESLLPQASASTRKETREQDHVSFGAYEGEKREVTAPLQNTGESSSKERSDSNEGAQSESPIEERERQGANIPT